MNLVGKTIGGKYKITDKIGTGGMATVYKGEHVYLKKPVAIKVLLPSFSENKELVERFFQEAETASKLDHPNIVKIFDFGDEEGFLYLVMQYIDGETLEKILQSVKKLPLRDAINITLQVLSALDYAHEKGLVHRDIKPANIMINKDGKAFLLDFGIAILAEAKRITKTKVAAGTPEYMAPEQFRGRADKRSDLYSVGVVLYEMITGRTPFGDAKDVYELQYKILREPVPPTGISEALDKVLQKALSKLPSERFQRAREFAEALLSLPEAEGLEYTVKKKTSISVPLVEEFEEEKDEGEKPKKITQFIELPEEEEFELEDKGFPWKLFITLAVLGLLILAAAIGLLWYFFAK
ncbi:MAG: serine/threonine-protein kinase [candidate division WOR-3 bacterium]